VSLIDAHLRQRPSRTQHRSRRRQPSPSGPLLAGLAVAAAHEPLSQDEALEGLGLAEDEFAQRIFARAGVQRRLLNLDEEYLARNLQGRTEQVESELLAVAVDTIDRLEVDPGSVGTLVTSSLYSLGCPTLAHRLIEHYGMDPSTDKYHVTGVGCASAVPLLRLGVQSLDHDPGRHVLVVAAESMSSILMGARDEDPRAKTVGSAIFGDGCAAALLSPEGSGAGAAILATYVHQIPGTLDAVMLAAEPEDSYLHLARELPDLAAAGLGELVRRFLAEHQVALAEVDHWIVHPGGRRIVEQTRDALDLDNADVEIAWRVLAERGNVGTPSIFYVLRSTLDERKPAAGEYGLVVTIGPGITVGLMLLRF
jgi:predicted naringenin-chalcone synthase